MFCSSYQLMGLSSPHAINKYCLKRRKISRIREDFTMSIRKSKWNSESNYRMKEFLLHARLLVWKNQNESRELLGMWDWSIHWTVMDCALCCLMVFSKKLYYSNSKNATWLADNDWTVEKDSWEKVRFNLRLAKWVGWNNLGRLGWAFGGKKKTA